jgi:Saxitoxin biosynthesis operon protein SxtJ
LSPVVHRHQNGREVLMGSNTRFGLVLVAACALIYGWGFWSGSAHTGWLIAAVIFLAITLTVPRVLEPAKKLWLKFGGLLHVVVSPVLLALFYYTVVTPIGLCMQLFGMDPLRLKRNQATYWIDREPPGPEPRTMTEVY